ncbi:MAG TPA: DUF4058 family protein [Pirellulales bacterium]|nr:DUF4058 family protein [Pirellulales bacterium]
MPSPSPGMNPYLERASVWHDFHESFMPLVREILTSQVLPRYFVRIDAPAEVGVPAVDSEGHSFLEIRDRDNRELVTVVELLSPSNKYAGSDREQYLAKARQLQNSLVHFVKIDLLRGGPRMPWLDMRPCDYCVVVSRVAQRPRAGLWPIRLRERLPEIPIPLLPGDADARIDLQQVLHRIYDAAGYAYHIYTGPPEPPLSGVDAAWAQQFLAAAQP